MKVELVGVGGGGEAIARIAKEREFVEQLVLADYDVERAQAVADALGGGNRFPVEQIDASDQRQIGRLALKYGVDLIMNAVDPIYNKPIFDAALATGKHYMDMAMTLSQPHPTHPYERVGVMLGDYQFAKHKEWSRAGKLALVGMGVEPGVADVLARYAADYLFDSIDEIGIRDGANLTVEGYKFAPTFSIWTTIEECLNPPVIWENGGWHTTEPFSEPEIFEFPEGIGQVEVVNVEHEEVVLVPRWINAQRVTFKYGLGRDFINVLRVLRQLGLDNKGKIMVKGVMVSPRDVVAACLPNPAQLGHLMRGKTCAGTWVRGKKNGVEKQMYLYQVTDNEESMKHFGCQAVVAQTAVGPVVAWDLIGHGIWQGTGVLGPEAFDPAPFMNKMGDYGFPCKVMEM